MFIFRPNVSQSQQARHKRRPNTGETLSIARTRRTYTKSDSKDRDTQECSRHATRHRHRQRNETMSKMQTSRSGSFVCSHVYHFPTANDEQKKELRSTVATWRADESDAANTAYAKKRAKRKWTTRASIPLPLAC